MHGFWLDFKSGLSKALGFSTGIIGMVIAGTVAYGAYSSLWASTNELLTRDKWNEMLQYTVPPGAVMAFNLVSCPNNWSPADGNGGRPDLRWQFIRGLNSFDGWTTVRSDGKQDSSSRSLGNWQDQILPPLDAAVYNNGSNVVLFKQRTVSSWTPTRFTNISADGNSSTASTLATEVMVWAGEVRPKNVAMIYCIKN